MTIDLHNDIEKVLLSEAQLAARIDELAAEIRRDYADKNPIMIGVLRGSFIFMADLVRKVDIPCTMEFISASSYGKKCTTSGEVTITREFDVDVTGRHVIMIEDILDSGRTLHFLMDLMQKKNPASVSVCTLLDKPARREVDVFAKYAGFEVPNEFVVGYGLDYADNYRNLPFIGVLKPSVYSSEE